jgi:hypothetical protein
VAIKEQGKDKLQKAVDAIDWAKIHAMTDEDIEAAARSDPDSPPLTGQELARMRPVDRAQRKKPAAAE